MVLFSKSDTKCPLVSVIVPCYNVEKCVGRCLDSLLSQTYSNMEIICVNDGSTDGTAGVLSEYAGKGVRVLTHEKNKGLFHARMTGVHNCKGDYIAFVDSDDYVSRDFYRPLVENAEKNKSDMVLCRVVHEKGEKKYVHTSYYNYDFPTLSGDEVFSKYMEQEGACFVWHTVWNKLYSRELWKKALPYLDEQDKHLVMAEDVAFSSVLFYFSKKFTYSKYSYYFYVQNKDASTSLDGNNTKKFKKNISDLGTAFDFADNFYKKVRIQDSEYRHFLNWRNLYSRFWNDNVKDFVKTIVSRNDLLRDVKNSFRVDVLRDTVPLDHYFYRHTADWDSRYMDLENRILSDSTDVVSFDLFDTLLVRPFYDPHDIFRIVEHKIRGKHCDLRNFARIRNDAEADCRRKSAAEEVTLDEIYDEICDSFFVDRKTCESIKKAEIETEIEFLRPRRSILNLLELARYAGKKVVIISDFYMGSDILGGVLKSNGIYADGLFISCDIGKTKRTGSLFTYVLDSLKIPESKMLHIGDNWNSDKTVPQKLGIGAWFYARTVDAFMYKISDIRATHLVNALTSRMGDEASNSRALEFLGIRSSVAIIGNEIYDNPYEPFADDSEFGCNLKTVGYGALGIYLLGISQWLLKNNKGRGCLHFVSRDGYLPKKAYDILNDGGCFGSDYVYMSRKALMPLRINGDADLYYLLNDVNLSNVTYRTLMDVMSPIIDTGRIHVGDPDAAVGSRENFMAFLKQLRNAVDPVRKEKYFSQCRKYFKGMFGKGDRVFDIGYSGRPQIILAGLLGYPIDAYYLHSINGDSSEDLSRSGVGVDTFYSHTPAVIGGIREYIISELAPSCIGYSSENGFGPVFEKYDPPYCTKYVIGTVQEYSLKFIRDFKDYFGEYMDIMQTRPHDASIFFEMFVNHSRWKDRDMFRVCDFEDDLYYGKKSNLVDNWNSALEYFRLTSMEDRLKRKEYDCTDVCRPQSKWFSGKFRSPRNKVLRSLGLFVLDPLETMRRMISKMRV